jgi:drug/metabolite transporter (DMT)-like permease
MMMIPGEDGILDPAGAGLIVNLIGLIVSAIAVLCVRRGRSPKVLTFWVLVAVVGVAVVVCGTSVVIASE